MALAAARILRMSRPTGLIGLSHEVFSTSAMLSRPRTLIMCLNKAGLSSNNPTGTGNGDERKPVAVKAAGCVSGCMIVSEPKTDKGVDLGFLLGCVANLMSSLMKFIRKERPWRWNIQMLVEKAIIDCRFFTLLATAGSLVGSAFCFVEGCVLVVESYLQYFHAISQMSEQGHVLLLLIEAIGMIPFLPSSCIHSDHLINFLALVFNTTNFPTDMFLVGTAMLIFGVALHVMFVGQQNLKGKGSQHSGSALSRNFNLEKLPSWIGMESAIQAKSKIGQAVIMILQVQVLEKFKTIPVVNSMDLACFAGAVFLSSASLFVFSRITFAHTEATR
ncbi:hypothetical protein Salat_0610300 [Sesamum alatum]|uniref:Uncharacterized protein n=1 Tax=Sesamum alatum TaxID=300844 RepID=A0AAE1YPY8_9LAMI|nr:hypothetical protein Salat_0610300 [Sesamum alatum]